MSEKKAMDPFRFQKKDKRTSISKPRAHSLSGPKKAKLQRQAAPQEPAPEVVKALLTLESVMGQTFQEVQAKFSAVYETLDHIQRENAIHSYLLHRTGAVSANEISAVRNSMHVIETFLYLAVSCAKAEGLDPQENIPLDALASLRMSDDVLETAKKEELPARMIWVFAQELTDPEPSMSFLIDWDANECTELDGEKLQETLSAGNTASLFCTEPAYVSAVSGEASVAALFSRAQFRLEGAERLNQLLNGLNLEELAARVEASHDRAQQVSDLVAEGAEVYSGSSSTSEELVGLSDVGDEGSE